MRVRNLIGVHFPRLKITDAESPFGSQGESSFLMIDGHSLTVLYRTHRNAKNYVMSIHSDQLIKVTIPRRGSVAEAERFVQSRRRWIERTLERLRRRPTPSRIWKAGTGVLFRGRLVPLQIEPQGDCWLVRLEAESVLLTEPEGDLRLAVERHLQGLARQELPARVLELAKLHQCPIRKIAIRSQRSRWGSCSRHGTISLNWRLVQVPIAVRDYIILHELMHLREMNHSRRFWEQVRSVCPDYDHAEAWLKEHTFYFSGGGGGFGEAR